MKSTRSIRRKWKILMTGATVKSALIIIGAVLACTAPFVHITLPKKSPAIKALQLQADQGAISDSSYREELTKLKEQQKMLGFSSPRRFWYAMGLPITLFFFATLFLVVMDLISDRGIRAAVRFSGFILFFIAVYHLVWVLWPGQDLPKNLYHLSIAAMAMSAAFLAFAIISHRKGLRAKIERLIRFISIDSYDKYIKVEDRPEYMKDSYEVYDEILDKK